MELKLLTEIIDIQKALDIRKEVFVKEQGVPIEMEVDEFDTITNSCVHVLVYYNGNPVGTGRLRVIDSTGKLERICILKPYRKLGLGQVIIKALEKATKEKGLSKIKLHAQTQAENFYNKLGYETSSEVFIEEDIPHILMTKNL